jgi:hypothetical protein
VASRLVGQDATLHAMVVNVNLHLLVTTAQPQKMLCTNAPLEVTRAEGLSSALRASPVNLHGTQGLDLVFYAIQDSTHQYTGLRHVPNAAANTTLDPAPMPLTKKVEFRIVQNTAPTVRITLH